jgi:hypothetical protein
MRISRSLKSVAVSSVLLAVLAVSAAACGDDDEDEGIEEPVQGSPTLAAPRTPESRGAESAIAVTLREYEVIVDAETVQAGQTTFSATNMGPEDEHEFVVIRSDLDSGDLPTNADGSVNEDEVDVIDEIEEFPVGEARELTVDLEPGSYVLICNVVVQEEGETESHYRNGMHTSLVVE